MQPVCFVTRNRQEETITEEQQGFLFAINHVLYEGN